MRGQRVRGLTAVEVVVASHISIWHRDQLGESRPQGAELDPADYHLVRLKVECVGRRGDSRNADERKAFRSPSICCVVTFA
jgi:hypothetical protein